MNDLLRHFLKLINHTTSYIVIRRLLVLKYSHPAQLSVLIPSILLQKLRTYILANLSRKVHQMKRRSSSERLKTGLQVIETFLFRYQASLQPTSSLPS